MGRIAVIAVVVLVAVAAGFALGRATGDTKTIYRTKKVVIHEGSTETADRLRKQFGIPTDEDSCKQFGIPAEACPGSSP